MFMNRALAFVLSAAALPVCALAADAPPIDGVFTCSNPTNGASWQIKIDYAKATVDANPARISDTTITWRESKEGRNYSLDRTSGNLTMVGASSTGGYFLYFRCAPKHSG